MTLLSTIAEVAADTKVSERTVCERIKSARAADITGLSLRQIQKMAARGLIRSAAKLGGVWTFNEARLRRWIASREEEACRTITISSSEAASGTPVFGLADATLDAAYERAINA